jgi:hypothetical protein
MVTALVAGALAAKAGNGGNAWTRISLVRGLARLGFDVVFLEELPGSSAEQARFFADVCRAFDIEGYLLDGRAPVPAERVLGAELLVNVGGHLSEASLLKAARVKVFLDDDPGYTQLWHAQGLLAGRLAAHDFHFTFGANIGRADCPLPTDGITWRPTRPVAVLDDWPVSDGGTSGRFTTVASWRGGYGRLEYEGRLLGQKAHEFRKLASLPRRVLRGRFEIALEIGPEDAADLDLLRRGGWAIVDPRRVVPDPDAFRGYVQGSDAELSAAQGVYVETRTGWFSDRSVRYLSSGKPVLVQDTGLTEQLPTGEGLLVFRTPEEALRGAEAIVEDYEQHARAARAIAEEHFDSDRVLGDLLEQVL